MGDTPLGIYAAMYANSDDAYYEYEDLCDLHAGHLVGIYDAAVVTEDAEARVHLHKHEQRTERGAWTGYAVGALLAILFPPSMVGTAAIGEAADSLIGSLARGMSRQDLDSLGHLVDKRRAALVVIGESPLRAQLDEFLTGADASVERETEADVIEFKRQLIAVGRDAIVA